MFKLLCWWFCVFVVFISPVKSLMCDDKGNRIRREDDWHHRHVPCHLSSSNNNEEMAQVNSFENPLKKESESTEMAQVNEAHMEVLSINEVQEGYQKKFKKISLQLTNRVTRGALADNTAVLGSILKDILAE